MNPKPSLEKVQESTHISTKRFPFKRQEEHEILNKKSFNQQIIKKKKAFNWKCKTGQADPVLGVINSELLARATKSDRKIQKFQVFHEAFFQRSNKGLNCFAQALKQLPYLKSLCLFFEVRTNEGFYQISKEIGNLIHLQKLRLSFRCYESFTDEALSLFTQSIRKLPLIEELDFRFRCNKITDRGLREISKCIKSLHRLRELAISFGYCQMTDVGLFEIQKGLKGLVRLENLRIYLDYSSMTDTGIQHLSKSLKGLIQMKSIQLKCSYYSREITETSLLTLGEDLKELRDLQNINLTFYGCLVTDNGIDAFSKNLKQLDSLERLSLSFRSNDQITDKGLELLGLNLQEVVSLKQVFLEFRNCSQAGRNKFFKSMKEHVKVKFYGDAARPIEKQEKRNNFFFAVPIIFGLIGWSVAQIKSALLGEGFSWMVFVYLAMSLLFFFYCCT